GGILSIELTRMTLDELTRKSFTDLGSGPYLRLRVRDTGCGMDEHVRKHIFDPFFTTKAPGKGTGLGLATVHRIVKDLKGELSLESEPGKGTTFTIYLPCSTKGTEEKIAC
ncbi:MAG: ATP-binding protein, partial [Desulfomonilia bacterium]|nr:ATP-binding protein [Desulfomonilia bacterium]